MYLFAVDTMDQPTKVVPTRLKFERGKFRVPNCALFDRNGTMTKFGSLARKRYNSLKGEDLKQSFFFAHVKMELQHDKVSRFMYALWLHC